MADVRIDINGVKWYYEGDCIHRDDGPACIIPRGIKVWYDHSFAVRTWMPNGFNEIITRTYEATRDYPNGYKAKVVLGTEEWEDVTVWPKL